MKLSLSFICLLAGATSALKIQASVDGIPNTKFNVEVVDSYKILDSIEKEGQNTPGYGFLALYGPGTLYHTFGQWEAEDLSKGFPPQFYWRFMVPYASHQPRYVSQSALHGSLVYLKASDNAPSDALQFEMKRKAVGVPPNSFYAVYNKQKLELWACSCLDTNGQNHPCYDESQNEILLLRTEPDKNGGECRRTSLFTDEVIKLKNKKDIENEIATNKKKEQRTLMEDYRKREDEAKRIVLEQKQIALEEEIRRNEEAKRKLLRESPGVWQLQPKAREWDVKCRDALKGIERPEYRVLDRMVVPALRTTAVNAGKLGYQWLFRMEWDGDNNLPPDQPQHIDCLGPTLDELSLKKPIIREWVNAIHMHERNVGLRRVMGFGTLKHSEAEVDRIKHLTYGYWTLQNTRILGVTNSIWKVFNKETGYAANFESRDLEFLGIEDLKAGFVLPEDDDLIRGVDLKKKGYWKEFTVERSLKKFFKLRGDFSFDSLSDMENLPFKITIQQELVPSKHIDTKALYMVKSVNDATWKPLAIYCQEEPTDDPEAIPRKKCLVRSVKDRSRRGETPLQRKLMGATDTAEQDILDAEKREIDRRRAAIEEMANYGFRGLAFGQTKRQLVVDHDLAQWVRERDQVIEASAGMRQNVHPAITRNNNE